MAENTTNYKVTERRPMKPREWSVMTDVAGMLNRAGVSPNSISIASIVACCIAGSAFAATSSFGGTGQRVLWLVGAVCVQLRAICNLLDGMVAVVSGKASPVGELYNEVPDRVSDAVMLIGLGYAVGSSPLLGFSAALVAVFVAYVRAQGRVAGAPQDYRGPMGKPHRMFLVTAVGLFLACTPNTWQKPWWGPECAWGVLQLAMWVIIIGGILTAARRLVAAGRALRGN